MTISLEKSLNQDMDELSALKFCYKQLSSQDKKVFSKIQSEKTEFTRSSLSKENISIIGLSIVLMPWGAFKFISLDLFPSKIIFFTLIIFELLLFYFLYLFRFNPRPIMMETWREFLILKSDNFNELLEKFKFLKETERENMIVYAARQYLGFVENFVSSEIEIHD